jgi:nitrate reductase (NAD(P)H)
MIAQQRATYAFKNTQPEHPVWNLMGMMNNVQYTVKASMEKKGRLLFRHPYHQEGHGQGWMTPSLENQIATTKQQSSNVPDKQVRRAEIEKHASKTDRWLVVNDLVYDVTSVLSWHPGGSATILSRAGQLNLEVTRQFESIDNGFADKQCVIGRVTDKAAAYMREQAKAFEAVKAVKAKADDGTFLRSKKWLPVKLIDRTQLSKDTFTYTFSYDQDSRTHGPRLKHGLGTCQHLRFGIHMLDKMRFQSFTPTRPISARDENGTFDLTVKTYFPDDKQPGSAFSNFLYELPLGRRVEVYGPTGGIVYHGKVSS